MDNTAEAYPAAVATAVSLLDDSIAVADPNTAAATKHGLRSAAALLKAVIDESSCESSGGYCDGATFCSHPTGEGGDMRELPRRG